LSGLILTQVMCRSSEYMPRDVMPALPQSSLLRPSRRTQWTCPDSLVLLPQDGVWRSGIRLSQIYACHQSRRLRCLQKTYAICPASHGKHVRCWQTDRKAVQIDSSGSTEQRLGTLGATVMRSSKIMLTNCPILRHCQKQKWRILRRDSFRSISMTLEHPHTVVSIVLTLQKESLPRPIDPIKLFAGIMPYTHLGPS
jgi:hypothetical protein